MQSTSAATHIADAIQPMMDEMTQRHCLAVGIALDIPGLEVIELCAGHRDRERTRAAEPGLLFQAGSQMKTYIGAAIALLAKQGRIDLGDPITHYLDKADRLVAAKPFTIRQLLHHTSGIGDFSFFLCEGTPIPWPMPRLTDDDIILLAAADGCKFEPATDWRYCNTGYALLGMLIEQVSGRSVADFLSDHVFAPLGLSDTLMAGHTTQPAERMAAGYFVSQLGGTREVRNATKLPDMSWARHAGDLVTSLRDALMWVRALATADRRIGISLHDLTHSCADLWAYPSQYPIRPRHYGFGISDPHICGRTCWGHGGGTPGFSSGTYVEPVSGTALSFYMTYEHNGSSDVEALLELKKSALLNVSLSLALNTLGQTPHEIQDAALKKDAVP